MNAVKVMLWALLLFCLGVNVAVTETKNGTPEVVLNVLTGLGVLGTITGLVLLRRVAR